MSVALRSSTQALICSRKGAAPVRHGLKAMKYTESESAAPRKATRRSGTEMQYGRFFTDVENRHHMPVVVVGQDVAKQSVAEY